MMVECPIFVKYVIHLPPFQWIERSRMSETRSCVSARIRMRRSVVGVASFDGFWREAVERGGKMYICVAILRWSST